MATKEFKSTPDREIDQYFNPDTREESQALDSQQRKIQRKRSISGVQTERIPGELQRFASISPSKDPVQSVKQWQKLQILSALEKVKEKERLKADLGQRQARKKTVVCREEQSTFLQKRRVSSQQWAEKLAKFRASERKSEESASKQCDLSLEKIDFRVQRVRHQRLEEGKHREESNKCRFESVKSHLRQQAKIADLEIMAGMQKYQLRMARSEKCHEDLLKSRAQTTAKRREKADFFALSTEKSAEEASVSRLMTYVKRQKAREEKAEASREEQSRTCEMQRKAREQRWQVVERNRKVWARKTEQRLREIEKKCSGSRSVQDSRHFSLMKDSFYRQEQREREENAHLNLMKLKRIQSARQAQLLSRSVEDSKRVESMKRSRRMTQAKYESALHSSIIERDRTYGLVAMISRSPDSRHAQKLVKDLSLDISA